MANGKYDGRDLCASVLDAQRCARDRSVAFVQIEEQIGFDVEFVVQQLDAVVAGFLFAEQPLADGRLIDAEQIGELLLAQIVFDHDFFQDIDVRHSFIIIFVRSKVLT